MTRDHNGPSRLPFRVCCLLGHSLIKGNAYLFISYIVPVEASAPKRTQYELDAKPEWVATSSVIGIDIGRHFTKVATGYPYWTTDHNDCCEACNKGGLLVECDYCNVVYHNGCLTAGQRPNGRDSNADWACPECATAQAAQCTAANIFAWKDEGSWGAVTKLAAANL